ncbi:MAG: tetratricopeptide repeat protein [Planctomycetes bacterium]|nr:tetratricopeptide repeat protein [Planctomycetota bacterium]
MLTMASLPGNLVLLAVHPGLLIGLLAGVLLIALVLWLVLAPGPQRGRAVARARILLGQGKWEEPLQIARALQNQGSVSPSWQERLRKLEADCLLAAGDQALQERRYEEGLQFYRQAGPLVGASAAAQLNRVVEAMLAELRHHFASGPAANQAIYKLAARILVLNPASAEAVFWQGLCLAREGQTDRAIAMLESAHQIGNRAFIDPPFYLGVLLYRQGRAQDALKVLAEASRVDTACPFVAWQVGQAMVVSGGDPGMAVRVLQRALGPKGFPLWLQSPHRAWVEAFPQGRSFVRRLAEQYPYPCPLLGGDLRALLRMAEQAVAQAHYRLGNFQDSADLFAKLLQDSAPTLPLLRGLGLALTRLGRYDQAYKHLRAAVEMEPQHALTAGYLALCGARGRPQQADDKPKNVAWAIRQVARFDVTGDREFAALMNDIYGEARELNMAVSCEDQVRLCNVLASVRACDPPAAAAYDQLGHDYPDALVPVYAWLYCRAAVQHNVKSDRDRQLFARTFRDRGPAQTFFASEGWDLEEVEYLFLERSAAVQPGRFPEELGPDYAGRGEQFLLERSQRLEQAGTLDGALRTANVLLRLSPRCLAGYDRTACLSYRKKDVDQAVRVLECWHQLDPDDSLPLVRRAVIEQQRGNATASQAAIQAALTLTRGTSRAAVAFLGARLALASPGRTAPDGAVSGNGLAKADGGLALVERRLLECLREQPDHADALWLLAALRSVTGDVAGLAALASSMERPEVKDARFHYLAAVSHLAAGDYARVLEAGKRAATDPALAVESQFVMAWAHWHLGDLASATTALTQVAGSNGPSAEHARALLGHAAFQRGAFADAVLWWTALDAGRRAEWQFDEALQQTVLLAGLVCFEGGQFEEAAEGFRLAGRLGLRDRRLGPLIGLSLFRAGQKLLYVDELATLC